MSTMIVPPSNLPSVSGGGVMVHAGKYAKTAVLTAFDQLGGVQGLVDWAKESAQNKADYYTKIFTKTIQKDVEINDARSIEDVLAVIDGEFTEVPKSIPGVGDPGQFANHGTGFAGPTIVFGVDEEDEAHVE